MQGVMICWKRDGDKSDVSLINQIAMEGSIMLVITCGDYLSIYTFTYLLICLFVCLFVCLLALIHASRVTQTVVPLLTSDTYVGSRGAAPVSQSGSQVRRCVCMYDSCVDSGRR